MRPSQWKELEELDRNNVTAFMVWWKDVFGTEFESGKGRVSGIGPIFSIIAAFFDLFVVGLQAYNVVIISNDGEVELNIEELRPRTDSLKRIISNNSV